MHFNKFRVIIQKQCVLLSQINNPYLKKTIKKEAINCPLSKSIFTTLAVNKYRTK
jgi:hypothetical protein